MAKLFFKYSTMNSGKTLDLIRVLHNYSENDCKTILLKRSNDTKGGDYIETRAGLRRKVDFLVGENESIMEILSGSLDDVKCIFIDESQLLSKNQVDELFLITKVMDIPVICYGLRTNFKMESFEGSRRLLEISEGLEEFKTLCSCGDIARYAGRKINGEFVKEGEEVVIDGEDDSVEYVPLCGKHYLEYVDGVDFTYHKDILTKRLVRKPNI